MGGTSYRVLYVHEYLWRKNKKRTGHGKFSRCHMRQSPRTACRVSPTRDRWCGLFCLDPFPRTPVLRNPHADWPNAPNRRPHRGQSEALAKPCPPVRPRSVHVFRHDTSVAFIGSCSLGGVVLDEAAQPARSSVIDLFSF